MKKIYLLAIILVVISIVLEIIYLTNNSILASESLKAEDIKNRITKYNEENKILQTEILSHSSLYVVASKAAEMGFERPSEVLVLSNSNSIALNRE